MTQIVPLVLTAIATHLTAECQTAIAVDDKTRVNDIVLGRYQDDPTIPVVHIAISGGDPAEPEMLDGIVSLSDHPEIKFNVPPREIGGYNTQWWRKGIVEIGCYYIQKGVTMEQATTWAYEVLGRLTYQLKLASVSGLTDSYGESSIGRPFVYASEFAPSGGEDARIFRGKLHWCVLTSQ